MTDMLWAKLEFIETAVEILDAVQGIFSKKNEHARIEITGKYSTAKIKVRTPVRDHIMMMTNYFTEVELHGAQIDEVTQVGIILNSLSADFIQFTSNYIMNKLNYNLSQLLNELQTFESISKLGKQMGSVNLTDRTSSSKARSLKKKVKIVAKRKNGGQASSSKGKSSFSDIRKPNFKKSGKASKPKDVKGKCLYCY